MTTPDEGVREIQLSGKQLVFLFMAVTVVSVVIFLCGVLVGRGVQTRSNGVVDAPVMAESGAVDDAGAPAAAEPAASTPTPRAEVTFPDRLDKNETPPEKLVPRKDPPAKTPAGAAASTATPATAAPIRSAPSPVAATPAPAAAAKVAADRPTPGIPTEPRGAGYAIQVAAFSGRGEAETIVKRLTGKGYSAYLVTPQAGQPSMFRVRVGKFTARADAERVATRLERE
jgi:cell division septation protein DedD